MSVVPGVPTLPTTPAWFMKVVGTILLVVGPVLAYADPGGSINTAAAQAVVAAAAIVGAFVIFSVDHIGEAIKAKGFTVAALAAAESAEQAELKTLWPEFKTQWESAKPDLDLLASAVPQIGVLANRVTEVEARVVTPLPPVVDIAALAHAVKVEILGPGAPTP